MRNVSVDYIKKRLNEVSSAFDPNLDTYKIIKGCVNNNFTSEKMMYELLKIGSTKNFPKEFQNFFYETFEELKLLVEKDKEIEFLLNKIEQKHHELQNEFLKRNLNYDVEFIRNNDFLNMTYEEKKDYIYVCQKELNKLEYQLSALSLDKKSGEKFDKKMEADSSRDNEIVFGNNEEVKEIQEKSEKNVIYFNNPSANDVLNYINDYRSNAQSNSRLNISVDYQSDGYVDLKIGYIGNEVNENYPMIKCNFSDVNFFNDEVYSMLLEEHVIDGGIKGYQIENQNLKSENLNEEKMEVSGNTNVILQTGVYLDNQKDMDYDLSNERKNKKVMVRKLDNPYNSSVARANGIVVVISLIFIIALLLFIFNYVL